MICPKCGNAYIIKVKIVGKLHKVKATCLCGKFKLEWVETR